MEKAGCSSTSSDTIARIRVKRSILFDGSSVGDRESMRECEAILIWAMSNLLDSRPWTELTDPEVLAIVTALPVAGGWRELWDGVAPRPRTLTNELLRHFCSVADPVTSGTEFYSKRADEEYPEVFLSHVRPTDACATFQLTDWASDDESIIIDSVTAPVAAAGPMRTTGAPLALNEEALLERLLLRLSERGGSRTAATIHSAGSALTSAPGGDADARFAAALAAAEATVKGAAAEALRLVGTKPAGHRRRRRKSRLGQSSDSEIESPVEEHNPQRRFRLALGAVADQAGGHGRLTREQRLALPILDTPAHLIEPYIIRMYLSPARFNAVYLLASKSQADLSKHLDLRQKAAKAERRGNSGLDLRNPSEVEPAFPWGFSFLDLGPEPRSAAASIRWGHWLLKAYLWLTNEDSDANHVDFALTLLKMSWPQFECELSHPDYCISSSRLAMFRKGVITAFNRRLPLLKDELSRLPTIYAGCVAQAAQVGPFLELITGQVDENSGTTTMGGIMSIVTQAAAILGHHNTPSANTVWLQTLGPFYNACLSARSTSEASPGAATTVIPFSESAWRVPSFGGAVSCFSPPPVQPASFGSAPSYQTMVQALPPPPYAPPPALAGGWSGGGPGNQPGGGQRNSQPEFRPLRFTDQRVDRQQPSDEGERATGRGLASNFADSDPWPCKPLGPALVGMKLARLFPPPPTYTCRFCGPDAVPHANGRHRVYECPIGYFLKYNEACPGYDRDGTVIPHDWAADQINLKPATIRRWKEYIARHRIPADAAETVQLGGGVNFDGERIGGMVEYRRPPRPWSRGRGRPG